jgi:hypothetical protein
MARFRRGRLGPEATGGKVLLASDLRMRSLVAVGSRHGRQRLTLGPARSGPAPSGPEVPLRRPVMDGRSRVLAPRGTDRSRRQRTGTKGLAPLCHGDSQHGPGPTLDELASGEEEAVDRLGTKAARSRLDLGMPALGL